MHWQNNGNLSETVTNYIKTERQHAAEGSHQCVVVSVVLA